MHNSFLLFSEGGWPGGDFFFFFSLSISYFFKSLWGGLVQYNYIIRISLVLSSCQFDNTEFFPGIPPSKFFVPQFELVLDNLYHVSK